MNAYLLGQQLPEVWDFGMFSIAKVGYQAQVIPALLAGLALGVIETRLKRIVPDYLYLVVVPVCSLILAVFPRPCADWSVWSHDWRWRCLCGTSPDDRQLCSDWRGIVWLPVPPLVITGVHQTTLAIDLQMIQSIGWYASVAADCAVEYRSGLRRDRHYHFQPQAQ